MAVASKKQQRALLLAQLREAIPAFAEKVAPLYRLLGWQWNGAGVPSSGLISECLAGLLQNLEKDYRVRSNSTGGLTARIMKGEDGWLTAQSGLYCFRNQVQLMLKRLAGARVPLPGLEG